MFAIENELLMFYTTLLQELLRTNTVELNLFLYAANKYVRPLQQLLAQLGFYEMPVPGESDQTTAQFDHTLLHAIKKFNLKHQISGDGARLKPFSLWRMLKTAEMLSIVNTIQSYKGEITDYQLENHALYDSLIRLLSFLDFRETSLEQSMAQFCIQKGLIFYPDKLNQAHKQYLTDAITYYLGEYYPQDSGKVQSEPATNVTPTPPLSILETPDRKISISDGLVQLILTKKEPGVYWQGVEEVGSFLARYSEKVNPGISNISLKVIEQVARNEGKLDAINTYDQAFLSIGIFQWTLGIGASAGELPALLFKLKANYPDQFNLWFTPLGIDVDAETDHTTGFITYLGERVGSPVQKEIFRHPRWAFYFWKALMQPEFQAIQIEHAHERFKHFYFKPEPKGLPYPLYQLITSSYGVALLLDQHVNRPGWVYPCIGIAMAENMNFNAPEHWSTDEEAQLLTSYVKIRANYSDGRYAPMTAASQRANQLRIAEQQGSLSKERGSFEYLSNQWEGFGMKGIRTALTPPAGYNPEDYPDITQ